LLSLLLFDAEVFRFVRLVAVDISLEFEFDRVLFWRTDDGRLDDIDDDEVIVDAVGAGDVDDADDDDDDDDDDDFLLLQCVLCAVVKDRRAVAAEGVRRPPTEKMAPKSGRSRRFPADDTRGRKLGTLMDSACGPGGADTLPLCARNDLIFLLPSCVPGVIVMECSRRCCP